jgi:acetoin utilization protein AcuB
MTLMKKTVRNYMTPDPVSVNLRESLEKVNDMMQRQGIRHMPVIDEGKLVGVVTDRDVRLAKGFRHGKLKDFEAADVFEDNVYITHPDSNLKEVAAEMASRRIGSAIVVEDDQPVGIFTTTDACRALSEVLG